MIMQLSQYLGTSAFSDKGIYLPGSYAFLHRLGSRII